MASQYDYIGKRYGSMMDLPAASIERASIEAVLGPVVGLTCLDLGSGLGRWAIMLVQQGAVSVVGVDISNAMVAAAREASATLPPDQDANPHFLVADCVAPLALEAAPFDLVFAAWFLNYAGSYEEQLDMWRNVSRNLKPGGRFVGIAPNAFLDLDEPVDGRYGVRVEAIGRVKDGWKTQLTADTHPEPVRFQNFI